MAISSTIFFREATLKLCNSMNIETALGESFRYIQTTMPAQGLILGLCSSENSAINSIAHFTSNGSKPALYPSFHGRLWEKIGEEWSKGSELDLFQDFDGNEEPIKKNPTLFFHQDTSYLALNLEQDKKSIGGIALYAPGRNRFKKEHSRLIATLHGPLVLALSFRRKQQELLKVREVLVKDILNLQEQLNTSKPDLKSVKPPGSPAGPEPFKPLDEVIACHIKKALDLTNGRVEGVSGSAALLGIHPSTLRARMRKLGIVFGKKSKKREF